MFHVADLRLMSLCFFSTGTRVYVFLKPIWQGRVEGLCGNYDGDSVNEYKKVDGSEGTALDFANSWAASTSCPTTSVGSSSEIIPCSVSVIPAFP